MPSEVVRSTVYLEADLHQALRLKAATAHRSISDIVNDAIRAALREDEEDLAAFAERDQEKPISYEELLARLKSDVIEQLRETNAGHSEYPAGQSDPTTAMTAGADPVLAELWDNPKDARYDRP